MTGRPRLNQPPTGQSNGAHEDRGKQLARRQYVRFALYKVDPVWRRLSQCSKVCQQKSGSNKGLKPLVQHQHFRLMA